jgi:hypothetical protein
VLAVILVVLGALAIVLLGVVGWRVKRRLA